MKMLRLISVASLMVCIFFKVPGQSGLELKKVDKFKIDKATIEVYFHDPLIALGNQHQDFDSKSSQEKFQLLDNYLHTVPLYVFKATNAKNGMNKTYILKGDLKKQRAMNYFQLHILSGTDHEIYEKGDFEKASITVDKVNIRGTLFEHMIVFQNEQGKAVIGKGIKFWDYFTRVEPYGDIKAEVRRLISLDLKNELPKEVLLTEEKIIEPLFDYQKCGLTIVAEREFTTTVYQYDSAGNIKNKYPRVEKDYDLYSSSISKELTGVTTFPFFSKSDSIIPVSGNLDSSIIMVNSSLANLNYYLKELTVFNDPEGHTEKISGKLIIHGFSAKGESTSEELYLAKFNKVGNCSLPTVIQFHPINDHDYSHPRIVIEVKYKLK